MPAVGRYSATVNGWGEAGICGSATGPRSFSRWRSKASRTRSWYITRPEIMRSLVSGRVMYHERVRDALLRHLEKDLGPVALPQIPASPQPFTVAEYLPTAGITPYHDPRQHAVSLAFVVPVSGDCEPQQDALELTWMNPEDACSEHVQREMTDGKGYLLRQAMAHVGRMP